MTSTTKAILKHLGIYILTCIFAVFLTVTILVLILSGNLPAFIVFFVFGVPTALFAAFVPYLIFIVSIKFIFKSSERYVYFIMGTICGAMSSWIFWPKTLEMEVPWTTNLLGLVGLFAGWVYYRLEKRFFGVES